MENMDIRIEAKKASVKHWQIANALGLREETLSRKLRFPLSEADRADIMETIKRLAREGEQHDCEK